MAQMDVLTDRNGPLSSRECYSEFAAVTMTELCGRTPAWNLARRPAPVLPAYPWRGGMFWFMWNRLSGS